MWLTASSLPLPLPLPLPLLLLSLCSLRAAGESYTTNAICLRQHCINPIFPALEELGELSVAPWYCSNLQQAKPYLGFCRGAINYDPSFPAANGPGEMTLEDIVRKQDGEAAKMFVYHLSGMGLDAWDYRQPRDSDDDCVKSVWRMVCYTYFPRAPIGCQAGMQTSYMRPCQSSCRNYIRACGVECCDESVQCVFEHRKELSAAQVITTTGYLPHDGPSTLCTGVAQRAARPQLALAAAAALLWVPGLPAPRQISQLLLLGIVPLLLQGCTYDVPSHSVGNWRAEQDYLMKFEFVPPGAPVRDAVLNSCQVDDLAAPLQCSGRGMCRAWEPDNPRSANLFCACDRDWADPECTTRRKSQAGTFLLSLFLGFLGVDHFYMGYTISGTLKLLTLGGGGLWWVFDFIRIGSAPVAAKNFKLAADLPHWVFVLTVVFFGMVLGFARLAQCFCAMFACRPCSTCGNRGSQETDTVKITFGPPDETDGKENAVPRAVSGKSVQPTEAEQDLYRQRRELEEEEERKRLQALEQLRLEREEQQRREEELRRQAALEQQRAQEAERRRRQQEEEARRLQEERRQQEELERQRLEAARRQAEAEEEERQRQEQLRSWLDQKGFTGLNERKKKKGIISSGFTYPLHTAVKEDDLPAIMLLLACGADKTLMDSAKQTPLVLALKLSKKGSHGQVINALKQQQILLEPRS